MHAKLSSVPTLIVALCVSVAVIGLLWVVFVPSLLRARVGYPAIPPRAEATSAGKTPAERLAALTASRRRIRSGQLTLEVPSYERAARELEGVAARLSGYVADSRGVSARAEPSRGTITIRVAADQFDTAVAAVRAIGRVSAEVVSTEDVTKAYVDLATRLGVKRDTEARLREILRDRSARLSDVVEAERELGRIIEEIEQAEGERLHYDHQLALSTLEVTLEEPATTIREASFLPIGAAVRGALPALAQSVAVLISVVAFLIPWLPAVALAFRLVRRLRARRGSRTVPEGA